MRQILIGVLLFLFGLLAPLWADRVMSGAPDWAWRWAAWACVVVGVFVLPPF